MAAQQKAMRTHDESEGQECVRGAVNNLLSFYYLQAELPVNKIVKSV